MASQLRETGQTILPILNRGLTLVSGALGRMATDALEVARTPLFQGSLTTLLGNTAEMFDRMQFALGDFVAGFVQLSAIGSEFLPSFGGRR